MEGQICNLQPGPPRVKNRSSNAMQTSLGYCLGDRGDPMGCETGVDLENLLG